MGKMYEKFKQAVDAWSQAPIPDLEPAPPESKRFDIKRSYTDEPITDADRLDLAEVRELPGYNVILAIHERSCEGFTTALVMTDPSDESAVLAAHKVTHTAWILYMSIQKQIETEISIVSSERERIAEEKALIDKALNPNDEETAGRVRDPLYMPDIRTTENIKEAIREVKKFKSQNPLDSILDENQ